MILKLRKKFLESISKSMSYGHKKSVISQENIHGKQGHLCYCKWCQKYSEGDFEMERYSISALSHHLAGCLLICCFLLGMAMKLLPIKGQTGAFKSSIMLSNLVLGIALVCQSVQALNSFVSKFTLLTRKHDKLKYIGKKLLTTWVENPSIGLV